jgi:hypothetical protein
MPVASDGLLLLRGPVRGGLAAATAGGRVLLMDSRSKWQVGAVISWGVSEGVRE